MESDTLSLEASDQEHRKQKADGRPWKKERASLKEKEDEDEETSKPLHL